MREYFSLLVGHIVTAGDAKCLAGIGHLDVATGMIADEYILVPCRCSPRLQFYEGS